MLPSKGPPATESHIASCCLGKRQISLAQHSVFIGTEPPILLLGHRPQDLAGSHNCSYHRGTPAAALEKMLLARKHTTASQMETRDIDKADRNRYTTSNRHPRTWDTKTYSASCVDFSATPNCTHAHVPICMHLSTGEHACTEVDTGLRSASLRPKS